MSEDAAKRQRARTGEATNLPFSSVQAISAMIKDLEVQLDRMIEINAGLDRELEQERTKRLQEKRRADELAAQLRRAERDAATNEDLLAEITHLTTERARLSDMVEELRRRVGEADHQGETHARDVARLRAARDEALEELESVEAQFERAMQIVGDHKTRLSVMTEEYDALRGRLKVMEENLTAVEAERDSLLGELDDSRAALEEIRRSLVDACVTAQYRGPGGDE